MYEQDWQAEDDARLIMRYQELKNDPVRLANAQKQLEKKVSQCKAALKDKPTVPARFNNRATIKKL